MTSVRQPRGPLHCAVWFQYMEIGKVITTIVHLAVFFLHPRTAKPPPSHSIELFVWFVLGLVMVRPISRILARVLRKDVPDVELGCS
jgi:hypothetical protein